jgi:chromosome segregation ATPase
LILGLIIFVGLIGIGALAVYVAIATPAEEQLQGMRVQATQTTVDLQRAQQDRDEAVQQRQEADTRAEEAEEQLAQEVTRNQVLRVMNAVITAQVAVVEEDSAEAGRALTTAENILRQAKPRLDQLDPSYTATFENLFSLARNDLERDLDFAAQDLERIRVELTRLDDALE